MIYMKQTVDKNIRVDLNSTTVRRADMCPMCIITNEVDKAIIYGELSTYQRNIFNRLLTVPVKVDSELFDAVMDAIGRG